MPSGAAATGSPKPITAAKVRAFVDFAGERLRTGIDLLAAR